LKALQAHPAFDAEIDRNALALYFRYCSVPAPYSIFSGISKVMAGTIVTLATSAGRREPEVSTYWSAKDVARRSLADPVTTSAEKAADRLAELLADSVQLRMESDRPVGAFLSGGTDSSTIAALMRAADQRPIKTFTIGFEEADEAVHARRVAEQLGCEHTEQYITAKEALEVIPSLPALYDEPFSDSSQIPTYFVSALARRDVTVILTGDGGDELFCGYNRYRWPPQAASSSSPGRLPHRESIEFYLEAMSHWARPTDLVRGSVEPSTVVRDVAQWVSGRDIRD